MKAVTHSASFLLPACFGFTASLLWLLQFRQTMMLKPPTETQNCLFRSLWMSSWTLHLYTYSQCIQHIPDVTASKNLFQQVLNCGHIPHRLFPWNSADVPSARGTKTASWHDNRAHRVPAVITSHHLVCKDCCCSAPDQGSSKSSVKHTVPSSFTFRQSQMCCCCCLNILLC